MFEIISKITVHRTVKNKKIHAYYLNVFLVQGHTPRELEHARTFIYYCNKTGKFAKIIAQLPPAIILLWIYANNFELLTYSDYIKMKKRTGLEEFKMLAYFQLSEKDSASYITFRTLEIMG